MDNGDVVYRPYLLKVLAIQGRWANLPQRGHGIWDRRVDTAMWHMAVSPSLSSAQLAISEEL